MKATVKWTNLTQQEIATRWALRLELQDGVPVLRASATVQHRITTLLRKHQDGALSPEETTELDRYEELDEYLSFLNRMVRNMLAAPQK